MTDSADREIRRHRLNLERAMDELAQISNRREQRVTEIRDDPDITVEEKRIMIDRVFDEERRRFDRFKRQADSAYNAAKELARRTQVNAKPAQEATERVRELLRRGLTHGQVLERARELGDMDMVVAARTEALWHGSKDAGFVDTAATITAANRILAEDGLAFDSDQARAILDLERTARPLKEITELAALSVDRTAKRGQIARARLSKGTPRAKD
jgi:nucleotide-binding universal stress UspA family protein